MKRLFLWILMICASASPSDATTYYVAANGSDDSTGTTTAKAWKTLAKVNAASLSAGDVVLFRRGNVWQGGLVAPSSGSAGNPIAFGAYGAGDKPSITGGIPTRGWSNAGQAANVWKYVKANTDSVYALWFGTALGTRVMTVAALNGDKKWQVWPDSLKVYLASASDTSSVVRSKDFCLNTNGKTYLSFSDLAFSYGSGGTAANGGGNVKLTGDYITLSRCLSEHSGGGQHVLLLGGNFTASFNLIRSEPSIGGIYNYGDSNSLLNNTILNASRSITVENGVAGTVIKNNLLSGAAVQFLYLIGTSTYTGANNLFFDPIYTNKWRKGSTTASSLSGSGGWYALSGQDSTLTSRTAYPKLTTYGAPGAGSPAINAGDNTLFSGTVADYRDKRVKGIRDIGAMEYVGRRSGGGISSELPQEISNEIRNW
jgi:hypothetical protein